MSIDPMVSVMQQTIEALRERLRLAEQSRDMQRTIAEDLERQLALSRAAWDARPFFPGPAWQLIETAPKDGTAFLGFEEDACEIIVWHEKYWATQAGWDGQVRHPTHWMPLPAPPGPAAKCVCGDPKCSMCWRRLAGAETGAIR